MVDTLELENKIKESGKTKTFIAKKIGRSIQCLNLKLNNKNEFLLSEVDVLCDELNINKLSEKNAIFFANGVDKKST